MKHGVATVTTSDPLRSWASLVACAKPHIIRPSYAAAVELAPPGMTVESFDLAPLPMFNQDAEKPFPEAVAEFRARCGAG